MGTRALVSAPGPDDDPAGDDKRLVGRNERVSRLSAQLRERLLIETLNQEVAMKAARAMVEILDGDDQKLKVELLRELVKQIPGAPESGKGSQQGGPVVAIQVNGGLRRGRREFA